MRATKNELVTRKTTKFVKADVHSSSAFRELFGEADSIGGVLRKGQLGWLARGPLLEIFSLRNGNKISSYRFDVATNFQRCFITCVSEIEAPNFNYCLLAVGVQFGDDPGGMISIYSVQESKVLRSIETAEKITCCHLINANVAERTVLEVFQGCLAIGTDVGKIILMDLYLRKCEQTLVEMKTSDDDFFLVPCHVVLSTMDAGHIRKHFRHSREDNIGFGVQMETVEDASLVLSIQSLGPLLALAVGLEDGRMILYSLTDLQPFHLAYPPEKEAPLVKLSFLEPPDDPYACIYIWAFHESPSSSIAVMHSIIYNSKTIDEDDGFCVFEGFKSCSVRLTLPMFERGSIPVSCQSVTVSPAQDSEETISLCLLAWKSKKCSEILIFDINQWYKEQMPRDGDWRDNLSYLASFPLRENDLIDVWLDERTIAPFNSIQRHEEHFYPISLSFDCVSFRDKDSVKYHWPGLQNRVLNVLNTAGSSALLEPSLYYYEIAKASLVPQNSPDYHFNSNIPVNAQREILLSVALEYNCFGLLKECAKCWADGSHLGRNPEMSLSLSTLTTWIWKRAEKIKERCNILCISLFDHSGIRMDQRSQIELSYCSRQLKLLADLLNIILTKCSAYIPEEVKTTLTTQHNSIKMAAEYQEVLQWFLNVGLLPEAPGESSRINPYLDNTFDSNTPLVPYPHRVLRNFYMSRRLEFKKINSGLLSPRTQSCRILYIDSFIEHECNASILRDHWLESGGNGLYPPSSLQAMLRTLLVPDVSIENKYVLFLYFFNDLNAALGVDERYAEVIENCLKFPSVFKMSTATIKTVEAFWHLDHGNYEASLENIISPFLHDHKLTQWQKELLIEALLVPRAYKLALRALQAPGPPISSLLELKTFLANDMVAEAFHLQRARHDQDLFKEFLNGCLYHGKLGDLLDLALNEDEDRLLEHYLRKIKSAKTENLHFVHLLQRSKYVEAIQQLDELSRSKNHDAVDLETPNLVLAAYNTTMTPATKQLSEVYYGIRNRLRAQAPEAQKLDTLSAQLLRGNANDLLGGVYQSSLMSVDEATNYWEEEVQKERKRLLYPSNVPFIRRPQLEAYFGIPTENTLCFPELYRGAQKRGRFDVSSETDMDAEQEIVENPRKRQKINDSLGSMKTAEPLNASLLTKFKQRLPNKSPPSNQQTSMANISQNRYNRISPVVSLNTPIVKSSRSAFESREESMSETSEASRVYRLGTPQSILKVRTAHSASVSSPLRRATELTPRRSQSPPNEVDATECMDGEKSIRFNLPSVNATVERAFHRSHESMESSPAESIAEEPFETEQRDISPRFSGPTARKSLRSTDTSLISAISGDDEFFSPVQSRDNSMRVTDKEESEPENEKTIDQIEPDINHLRHAGPKPRKPLVRLSRSRSKTPEIPPSPTRKSSRLLDKVTTKSVDVQESQTSSKSLSRLVIESEAKKVQSLTSIESTLFEKGRVFAHSTKLHEITTTTSTITEGEPKEPRKFAELSTLVGSTLHVPSSLHMTVTPTSETVSFEPKDDAAAAAADYHLNTTVGISGFEMTVDEISPPEKDKTRTLDTIGGRRTYKLRRNPLHEPTQIVETSQESKHETDPEDVVINETISENVESPGDAVNVMVDAERRTSTDSGEMVVETGQIHYAQDDQVMEVSDNDSEDEETVEEEYEEVVIDDEDDDDEEDESESDDNESAVADVISISSGNESSSTTSDSTTSSESRSSATPSVKNSEESVQTADGQDDEKLLYGDLEIEPTSSTSAEFSRPPSINEIEISFAPQKEESQVDSQMATMESNAVFNSTGTSMIYSDSGVSSGQPSAMTLNILTGEYENIVEDEDMERDFDLTKGRLEATSTTLTDVTSSAGGDSQSMITEQISSLSNEREISQKAEEVSSSKDIMSTSGPSTSSLTEDMAPLKVEEDQEKNKEKSTENVHEIRLEVGGDELNIASRDDNSQSNDEINAKTPVKPLIEIDSITDSGRVLRSTRRRSTSIDTTNTETELPAVDSPSITKRSLRASSVPRTDSTETPTKTLLRRRSNSTDNPATPTRVLTRRKSTLLDKIEEDTILDSPRRSTRKRIPAEGEIESEAVETPSTSAMKRLRQTSTSSLDTPVLPTTPRSNARRSVLAEDNTKTPQRSRRLSVSKDTPQADPNSETNEKVTRRRSKKPVTPEVANSDVDDEVLEGNPEDLAKIKGTGVRKLFIKATSEKPDSGKHSPPEDVAYEKSRRLTRNQQSVMEKSAEIAKKAIENVTPKKITRRRNSRLEESPNKKDDVSETASVVSVKSNISVASTENRRVTRRSLASKTDDDDTVSVASSTGSKRTRGRKPTVAPADKTLGAIVEEDQENAKNEHESEDEKESTHSMTSRGSAKKKTTGRAGKKTQK